MERVDKDRKERVMAFVNKATSQEYITTYPEIGAPVQKIKSEVEKGKKSKASGARFELRVRGDIETQGWIVAKWSNNLDVKDGKIVGKLVRCRPRFNPKTKNLMMNNPGFPDFISFKRRVEESYDVIGVEVKTNGTLSKIEKQKCHWLLENKIFSRILIAKKSKERGKVDYIDFKEKYVNKG